MRGAARWIVVAASLVGGALGGCSSGGAGLGVGDDGGTGGGRGVSLSVGKVDAPFSLGGGKPTNGRSFLTVDVTLTNDASRSAVPAASIYFSLVTKAGLSLTASPSSSATSSPCAADTSVTPGASYECVVAFEVPTSDAPAAIDYDDKLGDRASATVTYTKPTQSACEMTYPWRGMSSSACQACTGSATMPNGPCGPALQQLTKDAQAGKCSASTIQSCEMGCKQQYPSDAHGFCTCDDGCYGGCAPDYEAVLACVEMNCAASCP